jgi:hypothetical protein
MSRYIGEWPARRSEVFEELLLQVSVREHELKATLRNRGRERPGKLARVVTLWILALSFGLFLLVLAAVYFRSDTPSWARYGGIVAYLVATLALIARSVADGARGFAAIFAPMKHIYPLHVHSMKHDYETTTQLVVSTFWKELPEASQLMNIEAEELEQRRTLLFGLIEKAGVWPMLLAGNLAASGLAKADPSVTNGVAMSTLWPSFSAAAFVLVLANVSMKQYSMTLRRYAAMFERARLMMDKPEQS